MERTERPTTSTRDPGELRGRLEAWLATVLPPEAGPSVSGVEVPGATGMSSETLLFEAARQEDGDPRKEALVARIAPDPSTVPVFPVPSPLIERAFAWLDDHWPSDVGPTAPSWGDSRIGNGMYRDFEPVAVLDWEMAGLGPPEIDIAWMIFLHRFFEDLAHNLGLPGLRHVMRRDDVAATYEALSGYAPRDLDFYCVYAALWHAIVMSRVRGGPFTSARLRCPTTSTS